MAAAIVEFARVIRECEKAGLTQAAIAMAYIAMDAMAYLSLPEDRDRQNGNDYATWVDRYLKGHRDQSYQYQGTDVYGARCAYLHSFSSQATFHAQHLDTKYFAYTNGGRHLADPAVDKRLVLIGAASFLNDVICALDAFLEDCQRDADLRKRVERRMPHLLVARPLKKSEG